MTTRIAILDDYQNAALGAADWDSLGSDAEIEVFNDYIEGEDAVAGALKGFDVVVGPKVLPDEGESHDGQLQIDPGLSVTAVVDNHSG